MELGLGLSHKTREFNDLIENKEGITRINKEETKQSVFPSPKSNSDIPVPLFNLILFF